MERMDRLEDKISDLHDDVGVNMGATDHSRVLNETTRGEVAFAHQRRVEDAAADPAPADQDARATRRMNRIDVTVTRK